METIETYKIDFNLKDKYLKHFIKRYFTTVAIPLYLILGFIILMGYYSKENPGVGISIFLFIFISSFILFMPCRQSLFLTHWLKSEYKVDDNSITVIINSRPKRTINLDKEFTIKSISIGTFVLVGQHTFYDFYVKKHSSLSIPLSGQHIFIPTITENYDKLLEKLKLKNK